MWTNHDYLQWTQARANQAQIKASKTVSKPGPVQMQQVVSEEIAEENPNEEKVNCIEVKLKCLKALNLIFYFMKMKKGMKV